MILELAIMATCGYFGWKVERKVSQKQKQDVYREANKEDIQMD